METETSTKIIERNLPCILTDEERASFGRMAAHEVKEHNAIETEKKQVVADFGARLKESRKQIDTLSEKVDTGIEWRGVECRVQIDRYLGRVKITRTDTGEVIEDRPMTHDEGQTRMDM